jgi:hypothetical protein
MVQANSRDNIGVNSMEINGVARVADMMRTPVPVMVENQILGMNTFFHQIAKEQRQIEAEVDRKFGKDPFHRMLRKLSQGKMVELLLHGETRFP